MAPVPAPVLDCTESGLSVTANIMGILTFVAAIALALQLSLYEARQWLDQQQWARQYHDLQRRTRVQAILVSALLKKKDLPWYTKDMHLSDEYRKSNLERMNEDLGEWYTDFIALHGQVTNMLWFGFWINRPLVWLVKRRDRWLRAETDILKLRLDDVEKKFRKLDDEYPLSCQPVDHDL